MRVPCRIKVYLRSISNLYPAHLWVDRLLMLLLMSLASKSSIAGQKSKLRMAARMPASIMPDFILTELF